MRLFKIHWGALVLSVLTIAFLACGMKYLYQYHNDYGALEGKEVMESRYTIEEAPTDYLTALGVSFNGNVTLIAKVAKTNRPDDIYAVWDSLTEVFYVKRLNEQGWSCIVDMRDDLNGTDNYLMDQGEINESCTGNNFNPLLVPANDFSIKKPFTRDMIKLDITDLDGYY